MMDTYRAGKGFAEGAADGKEALAKYPNDPAISTSYALLLGENGQTDEAVKLLQAAAQERRIATAICI